MPIYTFHCAKCGADFEKLRQIRQYKRPVKCECGAMAKRTLALPQTTEKAYAKPILSEAMGVAPNQVAEMMRRFPDRKYTLDGRLIITSHAQRNRYLREEGMHCNDSYCG